MNTETSATSAHNAAKQTIAFWVTGEAKGELMREPLNACDKAHVKVRTLYSAISRGTEMLVFNNRVPVSEHEHMRAPFQGGNFPYPVKYGYINVGVVEEGPDYLRGKTVFCLYPHQKRYVVPVDAVTVVPENIPPARAVLAANMETAVNALWDANVNIGDQVSVVGAGVIGCLVAYLASRITGCQVELIDNNASRLETARLLNVAFATPENAATERDLLVHASASESGLNTAIRLAGMEAKIIELSWFGDRTVSASLGGAFHSKRLQICCSQVGQIAPAQRARWSYSRRLKLAISLLDNPMLDCLISGESQFEQLPGLMQVLSRGEPNTLCHRIRYS
ncbi:MAG: zinc-binding alcohol dehydrogenase [Granulosicoccus sp.]